MSAPDTALGMNEPERCRGRRWGDAKTSARRRERAHAPLAPVPLSLYDRGMETPLNPEIESMIRRHLAHGCSSTPESVIKKALDALNAQEAQDARHEDAAMQDEDASPQPDPSAPQETPLLQWLRDTSAQAPSLKDLRRRLAGIPGSLSESVAEERHDRL